MKVDRKPYYVSLILSGMFLIGFIFLAQLPNIYAFISLPFGVASFLFFYNGGLSLVFSFLNKSKEGKKLWKKK